MNSKVVNVESWIKKSSFRFFSHFYCLKIEESLYLSRYKRSEVTIVEKFCIEEEIIFRDS